MSQPSREAIEAALRAVPAPDGEDPIASGLIGAIAIKDGAVQASIEIARDDAAGMEPFRRACAEAIKKVPGVRTAVVVLTAEREKPSPPPAAPGASKREHKPLAEEARAIVAVASGKGGVGKSTTSVNLAFGLAREGLSVGLLDADIYGPSTPRMTGMRSKPISRDGSKLEPLTRDGVRMMSMGLLVDEDAPMIWRGPMVQSAIVQMLGDVDWGPLDVLVVDMPPGTGDAQLTMAQRVPMAGAVIVSTPQDIALLDAKKAIAMFEKTRVPILGVVENMSYFACPHCGERTEIFAHGGARAAAEAGDVPFLGEIPLDLSIRERSDAGDPIVLGDGPIAQAYRELARAVASALEVRGAGEGPSIRFE